MSLCLRIVKDTSKTLLNKRLAFLDDKDSAAGLCHLQSQFLRERITGYLERRIRTSVREVLHQIVVSDAAGDDSLAVIRPVHKHVVLRHNGIILKSDQITGKFKDALS